MVLVIDDVTLVGRDHERAILAGSAAAAREGHGSFILVSGDAGIGKTSIVRQALSGAGLPVLNGQSYQGVSLPYGPLAAALRDYLATVPDAHLAAGPSASQLALLMPELGTPPPASDRSALFEALRTTFVAIACRRPLALFLDDLHWADQATLDLLPALAGALAHESLLIVATYRSDEIQRGHPIRRLRAELRRAGRLRELAITALDPATTSELIARIIGGRPSQSLTTAIHDRTEGVPFFIEELTAALASSTQLRETPDGLALDEDGTLPLPESVRDVIALQVEAFPPEARRVLEIAAVAGHRFDIDLVTTLAGDDESGLALLLDNGFLIEPESGQGAFRHALKREACYLDITWARRRALHQQIAAYLQDHNAPAAIVAEHWLASRDQENARRALIAAGEASCQIHAYRDAVAAFRRAVELWPESSDDPQRIATLERLGACAKRAGDLVEATRALREVVDAHRQTGDPVQLAASESTLAAVYELRGDWVQALAAREAAAGAYAAANQPAEASSERILAASHLRAASNFHGALSVLEAARQDVERSGRVDLQARLHSLEGNIRVRLGEHEAGLRLIRTCLALALERHLAETVAIVYQLLADALEHTGDYASAKEVYQRAYDYCRRNAADSTGSICLGCLAVVLRQTGEWERAIEVCREVLAAPVSPPHARAAAAGTLGLVHAVRGEARVARPLLVEAAMLTRRIELTPMEILVNWGLALLDDQQGATEAAIARCREMLSRWKQTEDRHYIIPIFSWAATYCAEHGAEAEARAFAAALVSIAAGSGQPEATAALAHGLGEIALLDGNSSQAIGQFEQALALMQDSQTPFDRAQTERRLGNALAQNGQQQRAISHLTSAHRAARKLGARPLATLIARDLKALGEPVERHLGRRAAGQLNNGGLSRREMDVLRLVAVGRTSREIGEALFISPRTVEMHVQSILGKLDCRSRAEATRKASELGLLQSSVEELV